MQIGIDSFITSSLPQSQWGAQSDARRVREFLEEVELADRIGLDVYGVGEHHRPEFIASSPAVLLAAAAARTKNIRLVSAVSVLSSDDPIRLYQQFATLDLISGGRAEIIVGRGSFIESYPLFGFDLSDYDSLFVEKLDLLLKARASASVHWSGQHRPPLKGEGVYPRALQEPLPVRIGVGGTPESFARAGTLGLPLIVAIIGGEAHRFRPLVDLYREAGRRAGHAPETLTVGMHSIGYVADTTQQAADEFYPYYEDTFSRLGRERGWGPTSRAQYDAVRGPSGALLVGDPETVAAKILRASEALGGLTRVTIGVNGGEKLPHDKVMRCIELIGTRLAPLLRTELGVAGA
ncbi:MULTISPECIES: LLM class flavin-dependent oxidoreductase [Rhodomicrobium]|uniref:LLM class flavin-dependent oxidoreductase n=1 Tax=Rhodomicrobium TaxID=1068 RepID=UPI000B4C1AF3|nr:MULTISPECIES: LLM class flavin-dependent oxidoreductase [Rhodomicrobium]